MIDDLPHFVPSNPDQSELRDLIETILRWGHTLNTEHNMLNDALVGVLRRNETEGVAELQQQVLDLQDKVAELAQAVEQLEAGE